MLSDPCSSYQEDVEKLAQEFATAIKSGRFDWRDDFSSKLAWDVRHHNRVGDTEGRATTVRCSPNRDAILDEQKLLPELKDASGEPNEEEDIAYVAFWWDVWEALGALVGGDPDQVITQRMEDQK